MFDNANESPACLGRGKLDAWAGFIQGIRRMSSGHRCFTDCYTSSTWRSARMTTMTTNLANHRHETQKTTTTERGGQLRLRCLRRGDRDPGGPVGGRKPGVRRGLSGLLPTERHPCGDRRGRRRASVGRSGIETKKTENGFSWTISNSSRCTKAKHRGTRDGHSLPSSNWPRRARSVAASST